MTLSSFSPARGRGWLLYALAAALFVIGAKVWMITYAGSPTPYWDQWDAEAARLYPHFLNGNLSLADLIAPHNEHRIMTTRLWLLMVLALNGYWDPVLQMLSNTVVLGAFTVAFVALFRRLLAGPEWIAFALLTAIVLALPVGWEDAVEAINTQYYMVMLLATTGLAVIAPAAAFTPRWWLAFVILVAGYFSSAGGALAAAAAIGLSAVQLIVRSRAGRREFIALGLLAVVTLAMVLFTPTVPYNAPLRATSVTQFLHALIEIGGWPLGVDHADPRLLLVIALFVQAPAAIVCLDVLRRRLPLSDPRWLVVALVGWFAAEAVAIAYGRAPYPTWPRYLDLYTVGLLTDAACLFYAIRTIGAPRVLRAATVGVAGLWLLLVSFALTRTVFVHALPELQERQRAGAFMTGTMRKWLETGDIHVFDNQSYWYRPYPFPERLVKLASQPEIRAILPPELVGPESAARAQSHGLARFTGAAMQTLKRAALHWGVLLMPAGFVLFLLGFAVPRREATDLPTAPGTP
jgi:hypothetical protein